MLQPKSFFIALLLIFFAYILVHVDYGFLQDSLKKLVYLDYLILLFLFGLSYFVKALRNKFLSKKISLLKIVLITIWHNFYLIFLPLRAGELIYIRELKKHNIKVSKSTSNILIMRFADLSSLFILGAVSYAFYIKQPILTVILALLSLVLLLLFFSRWYVYVFRFLKKMFAKTGFDKIAIFLGDLVLDIYVFSFIERLKIFLFSFVIWLATMSPWLYLLNNLFIIPWYAAFAAGSVAVLFTILPINPPGGAGIIQVGWIGGLSMVGLSLQEAAGFSVMAHGLLLLQIIFYFLFSHLIFFTNKNN